MSWGFGWVRDLTPPSQEAARTTADVEAAPGSNQAALASLKGGVCEPEAAPEEQLAELGAEFARRGADRDAGVSTPEGRTSATVPLRLLVSPPPLLDEQAVYEVMRAAPDDAKNVAGRLASGWAVAEYLEDKLDWPVTIHLEDHDDTTWLLYSVRGEELFASKRLEFPLESLDAVSREPLSETTKRAASRAAQLVTAAVLESLRPDMLELRSRAAGALDDPDHYALNAVQNDDTLARAYLAKLQDLVASLDESNAFLRATLAERLNEFFPIAELARAASSHAYTVHYHRDQDLAKFAGEIYDEAIEEHGAVAGFFLGIGRGIGNVVTGGGQSLDAKNAQMFRHGEISWDDFQTNRWTNIARVGVVAVVSAVSGGRASGPALEILGLEEGTLAAGITGGAAEGTAGGFVQSIASDAFAKTVQTFSDSPGVRAFEGETIVGPRGWIASAAQGGQFGMFQGAAGALVPEASPQVSKAAAGEEPAAPAPDVSSAEEPVSLPAAETPLALPPGEADALAATPASDLGDLATLTGDAESTTADPGATPMDAPLEGSVVDTPLGAMRIVSVLDGERVVLEPVDALPFPGAREAGMIDLQPVGVREDGTIVYAMGDASNEALPFGPPAPKALPEPNLAMEPYGGAFGMRPEDMLGGNDLVTSPSTGVRMRAWRWFERQIRGVRPPSISNVYARLRNRLRFPGRSRAQGAVRPDLAKLDLSGTVEVKMRNWENPSNVQDAIGTVARNVVIHEQAAMAGNATARMAEIEIVTHNQVSAQVQGVVVRGVARWMLDHGYTPTQVLDWLSRIRWTRVRFEYPQ